MSAGTQSTLKKPEVWGTWWSRDTVDVEHGPLTTNQMRCKAGCGDIIQSNDLPRHLRLKCKAADREVTY